MVNIAITDMMYNEILKNYILCTQSWYYIHMMYWQLDIYQLCLDQSIGAIFVKEENKTLAQMNFVMPPRRIVGGEGEGPFQFTLVCPSGYRYMVCPAISSYSFGAKALIFCMMFIHIMEVCMFTGFWFSSNILKMTGSWTFFMPPWKVGGGIFVKYSQNDR